MKLNKHGFTLIELLIVIAIISLLAAILFPVFGRARENARRTSCLSNLKQTGIAFYQYSQDYDEQMVPIRLSSTRYFIWNKLIDPYLKSPQVHICPSNSQDKKQSYAYNLSAGGGPILNMSVYQVPAQTVILTESLGVTNLGDKEALLFFVNGTGTATNRWFGRVVTDDGGIRGDCTPEALPHAGIHLDGANYMFADGHAKWYRYTDGAVPNSTCGGSVPAVLKNNGAYKGPHREGLIYNPQGGTIAGDSVYR